MLAVGMMALAAWIVAAWVIADAIGRADESRILRAADARADAQIDSLARDIGVGLIHVRGMATLIAQNPEIVGALPEGTQAHRSPRRAHGSGAAVALGDADRELAASAQALGFSVAWLMDLRGRCVAASNAGEPTSFVGTNYADRVYFRMAVAGHDGDQYAMGRMTNIGGLFFSAPVRRGEGIAGVLAVKVNLPDLEYWVNQSNAFIADRYGAIILAHDRSMEMRVVPGAALRGLAPHVRLERYKRTVFEPLALEPVPHARVADLFRLGTLDAPVLLRSHAFPDDGITAYTYTEVPGLAAIGPERLRMFLLLASAGCLILLTGFGGGLFVLARHREAHDLRDAHDRLSLALDASHLALWDYDIRNDRILVDARWHSMVGAGDGAASLTGEELRRAVHAEDLARVRGDILAALEGRSAGIDVELRHRGADGRWRWIRCTGRIVERDAAGRALRALGTNQDVTERKSAEDRVQEAALRDWLTGLPNRFALARHLRDGLLRARELDRLVAVCLIDLDDFKPVNDKWGHEAGDGLLRDLSHRLKELLREPDFLARLGGDEFVIVIEGLEEAAIDAQLGAALERLHQAVQRPFVVGTGEQVEIGMSCGVALFPLDAEEPDGLLRRADVVMYVAKHKKLHRTKWWNREASPVELTAGPEVKPDPFGEEASHLLRSYANLVAQAVEGYAASFYDTVGWDEAKSAILGVLTPPELAALQGAHIANVKSLLGPDAQRQDLRRDGAALGKVHCLVGVAAPMLVESADLLRSSISRALDDASIPSRDRYRIMGVVDARSQEQLRVQLDTGVMVMRRYLEVLSRPLPPKGSLWTDARAAELDVLGALDGVRGVLLMRLASNGVFAVEGSAGVVHREIAGILQEHGSEAVIDATSPRGQGLTARAWRSGLIERCASYSRNPGYAHWLQRAGPIHVRSTMSIPVHDYGGQVVAVLSFFGAYLNQFESLTMQQFARGLQQRWEQIWARCSTLAPVVNERQAIALRERVFSGGLEMFMQPVVDLRSGVVVKFESLARLRLEDGSTVSPAMFLPVLGDSDLDHVFRIGLDQALRQQAQLQARGWPLDVAVNLAPTTLLDKDCVDWVDEALRRHRMEPSRVTLELLETEASDSARQDEAMHRLVGLGVRLSMDDLGSGYSSLYRLTRLPFDSIKIDQSLTLSLRESPLLNLPLMRSVIQLGIDLRRAVIVEGLEDEGMIEAACILGATFGQGYALARPMAQSQFADWIERFHMPARNDDIHTFLGALAYHWLHAQGVGGVEDVPVEVCPLTRFFEVRGLARSQAAQWHRQCHQPGQGAKASRKLMAWLVDRVADESAREVSQSTATPHRAAEPTAP